MCNREEKSREGDESERVRKMGFGRVSGVIEFYYDANFAPWHSKKNKAGKGGQRKDRPR